jgi:hypothetical protein
MLWRPRQASRPAQSLYEAIKGRHILCSFAVTGFEWNGTCYGSLSEIATLITGSRRSGPKFFGLKP